MDMIKVCNNYCIGTNCLYSICIEYLEKGTEPLENS